MQWLNKQSRSGREDFRLADYLDPADIRLIEARYDGCINYVDDQLRGLIEWLRQVGLYENTLILITSDHGEEFLDHGRFLHRNTRFEELVSIPLLVKFPHSTFAGERVPYLGAMLDLMPTILDVVGIEPHPQVMGVSLLPTLTGRQPVRDSKMIFSAVRTERWKYLRTPDEELLFDLQEDSGELSDVLAEHPELVEKLAAESDRGTRENRRRRQAFQAGREEQEPLQLTREEIEELEALGYID